MIRGDVQATIDYLNELIALDREAIEKLVEYRVTCNDALAAHSSVQVVQSVDGDVSVVGLLGVVNGLHGVFDEGSKTGWGPITAVFDDAGHLVCFRRSDAPAIQPEEGRWLS